MFATGPLHAANGVVDHGRIPHRPAGEGREADFSVPGIVAAAIWAVGLVVGVFAMATGHAVVAVVALVVAVAAPWFGLVCVAHGRRRVYNVALYLHVPRAAGSASLGSSVRPAEAPFGLLS